MIYDRICLNIITPVKRVSFKSNVHLPDQTPTQQQTNVGKKSVHCREIFNMFNIFLTVNRCFADICLLLCRDRIRKKSG